LTSQALSPRQATPASPAFSPNQAISPRQSTPAVEENLLITVNPPLDLAIMTMKPHQVAQFTLVGHPSFQLSHLSVKGTSKTGGALGFNVIEQASKVFSIQFIPLFSGNHAIAITYKSRQVSGSPLGFVVPDCEGTFVGTLTDPAQMSKLLRTPTNLTPGVPVSLHTTPIFNHQFAPVETFNLNDVLIDISGPCSCQGFVTQVLNDRSVQFSFTPQIMGEYRIQVKLFQKPIFAEPAVINVKSGNLDSKVSAASELDMLLNGMGFS